MGGVEHEQVGTVKPRVVLPTGGGGVEELRETQNALSPRSPPQVGSTPGWDRCVKRSASVAAIAPVAAGAVALVVVAPVIVVAPVVAAALVIIVTLVVVHALSS